VLPEAVDVFNRAVVTASWGVSFAWGIMRNAWLLLVCVTDHTLQGSKTNGHACVNIGPLVEGRAYAAAGIVRYSNRFLIAECVLFC
jgi:hypothetical protein